MVKFQTVQNQIDFCADPVIIHNLICGIAAKKVRYWDIDRLATDSFDRTMSMLRPLRVSVQTLVNLTPAPAAFIYYFFFRCHRADKQTNCLCRVTLSNGNIPTRVE